MERQLQETPCFHKWNSDLSEPFSIIKYLPLESCYSFRKQTKMNGLHPSCLCWTHVTLMLRHRSKCVTSLSVILSALGFIS